MTSTHEFLYAHNVGMPAMSIVQKPIVNSTLADKDEIIRTTIFCIKCLAELEQLKKGLNVLGVIDAMAKNPDVFVYLSIYFINQQEKINCRFVFQQFLIYQHVII